MQWLDEAFNLFLLVILILCSLVVYIKKEIVSAVVIFSVYSFIMAIVWLELKAPDLAITEAAVGAGITTILFVIAIKKMGGRWD
ncbi:Uncharacterized MnhB-related membrane protein [Caldanaerovirga acetigignens]|uniref:Uncharacterized MnhB-related membrane protein n=1 Tax=Caldanaerovirga acetigignens TaxID=447595 RepID=A0A1M7JKV8_9FIRM|nr:hydrogenase subunit MbhD domain-containing protein [Caldanaerovirga acetigignens]SHM53137.1 Uncharacterized MnhB-related membrane protein [Caldanaerovirga acetigignens]